MIDLVQIYGAYKLRFTSLVNLLGKIELSSLF
jgi:hypothetical protein